MLSVRISVYFSVERYQRLIFARKKLSFLPIDATELSANSPFEEASWHVQEGAMDWDRIEKNWQQVKQKIKGKWERLSDDDLDAINGRRERLEDKIHEHYGFAFDHVRKEVDDWLQWQTKQLRPDSGATRTDVALKRL